METKTTTQKQVEKVGVRLTAFDFNSIVNALEFQFNAFTTKKGFYENSDEVVTAICNTLPKLMQAEKIAWNFKSGHRKELVLELYKEVEN